MAQTRAHQLTFDSFKKNLLDQVNGDLCLCIGVDKNYDYDNPFYKLAKYKFIHDETIEFSIAVDHASDIILKENPTNEKQLHWRQFFLIKDQFLGGLKDKNEHPGSAGILIFFRWFLLSKLKENNLINEYDRFIITRSDYIYKLPHPKMELMDPNNIWIPNHQHWGGYTDRHAVLSKNNIEQYLNLLNNMVTQSHKYFNTMNAIECKRNVWNLESFIKFHLFMTDSIKYVKEYPYIMYTVRDKDTKTRWSEGVFNEELGYFLKYQGEYDIANHYKKLYESSNINIDDFYKKHLN